MTPTWQSPCGTVTLYLGDCLAVLPSIGAESCDMVWTDPPYGHGNHNGDWNGRLNDHRGLPQQPIANDDPDGMRRVVDAALAQCTRVLTRDCCCCCCGGGGGYLRPTFAWLAGRMNTGGLSFFHSVIWDKINPGLGWRYRRQHEMVMVGHRAGGRLAWNPARDAQPNVIRLSKPREAEHPNAKPVDLPQWFIENHTAAGDTILDPFMGSGTTGVACIRTGRRFIGIEIDPHYFEVARSRLERELRQPRLMPVEQPPAPVQAELFPPAAAPAPSSSPIPSPTTQATAAGVTNQPEEG